MGTIIVGMIVFGTIGLIAVKVYKDHKKGKCCGCIYESSCKQSEKTSCQ